MGIVIDLDERRPHLSVIPPDGNAHVIPTSVIDDIIAGRKTIDCLDDRDMLVRAILDDWMWRLD